MGLAAVAVETRDWGTLSVEEGRGVLRGWREEGVRRSEEVVELWEHVISRHPSALAEELWIVLEQVCVAGLDCGRLDVAKECEDQLKAQFPASHRVMKIQAMRLEAMEKYDDALDVYENLIQREPTNAGYRKRRVAVLKAEGRRADAIRELVSYLTTFLNDTEAWTQLMQLYLDDGDYVKAAHCAEELILGSPSNHLYHQRYAEIKYSQGGNEAMEVAKQHFSEAVKMNPKSGRSLYGLLLTAAFLGSKLSGQKKKEALNLAIRSATQLIHLYNQEGCGNPAVDSHVKTVEDLQTSLLAQLGAASTTP